ncbi:sensor histidine kinase [Nocardiopsis alborubida]|uniref:Histidine kinase n=1 Tax=Nocardiopsis alborubida TaxID=146802 RepID=A0A7X6MIH1_9ACTN|nr:histidine kinase [Nocardiopsis alborubida]NKZ01863.1 histidine kinase [Nocardiopsis alborubida]
MEHDGTATAVPGDPGRADTAGPRSAPDAGKGDDTRFVRRLRISRRFVLWSMAALALFVPTQAFSELVVLAVVQRGDAIDRVEPWRSAAAFVLALPCGAAGFWMARARVDGRRVADPRLYWGSLVLLALVCAFVQTPFTAFFVCASWWGMAVLVASRRRSVRVTLVLLVLPWTHFLFTPLDPPLKMTAVLWLTAVAWTLVVSSGYLALIRLWDITHEALEGQRARARLAVSRERLRFTQDMQGVIGQGLTTLAVRARRAELLLESDPVRSAAEINEVHELARRVLQQVRSSVSGYRGIDLAEEMESVGAVLRANGTEAVVTGTAVPKRFPAAAGLAAWVVREGATNVLRHSDARRCRISFSVEDAGQRGRALVVEVSNDRARGGPETGAASASGLAGLSQRVSREGGTLSATRTDDGGFLLRAVIPLPDGAHHTEESR